MRYEYTRKSMPLIERIILFISYNGGEFPPSESYHPARWRAMVSHIEREYLNTSHKQSTGGQSPS